MANPEPKRLSPPTLLFIDLESSGLYKERLSIDDNQQPFAVSIAAALCTAEGDFINFARMLIKPEGRTIERKAEDVHGISARTASQYGIPEARALGLLSDLLKTMPMDSYIKCISYGDFDPRLLSSLFARFAVSQGKPSSAYDRLWLRRPYVEFVNLMTPWAEQLCKIPSKEVEGSFKWPSLDEAAEIILGREPRGSKHDAWQDMLLLRDLYLECDRRGLFGKREAA